MFVEELYNEIRLYNNQGQSQYFSPEEVMLALNRAQKDKYRAEFKVYEATQMVSDAMRNFKKTFDLSHTQDKVFTIPPDYFNQTNISSLLPDPASTPEVPLPEIEYSGKIYTDGEWLEAKESELLPPENEHIKARIIAGFIEVLPITVTKIRLYYLIRPVDAVYAYDVINDQIVFKEQGSVDPAWPETEFTDLIVRTLKYLGITQRDETDMAAEKLING